MNCLNEAHGQGPGASLVFLRGGEVACRLGLAWELGLSSWLGLCPRRGYSLRSEPHGGLRGAPLWRWGQCGPDPGPSPRGTEQVALGGVMG